jgi:protein SCO1/2
MKPIPQQQLLKPLLIVTMWFSMCLALPLCADDGDEQYDSDAALAISQAAIGSELPHLELTNSSGEVIQLSEFVGRPILISMIFTSCYHVCPAITRHLSTAVDAAREVLGDDSFQVLTIGFDTSNDSPDAMKAFAQAQKIDDPNWAFLSGSEQSMVQLIDQIGFVFYPSPRGFDHINQVTVVAPDGVIYRQVYGAAFELPWLVEPLKELVYKRPQAESHFVAGFFDRIRLFCTVYDPSSGRYRFDYSLFVQIAVGAMALLLVASWLILETRRSRRRKRTEI